MESDNVQTYLQISPQKGFVLSFKKSLLKDLFIDIITRRGYHPLFSSSKFRQTVITDQQPQWDQSIHVTEPQAVIIIWKCFARQLGLPLNHQNPSILRIELSKILNSSGIIIQQQLDKIYSPKKALKKKIKRLSKQAKQMIEQISEIFQKITKNNTLQDPMKETYTLCIKEELEENILRIEKQVFLRSLLGIRKTKYRGQIQNQKDKIFVYLIFEQAYPEIVVSLERAEKLLGQQVVEDRAKQYKKYKQKYFSGDSPLLVCHKCLSPIQFIKNPFYCDNTSAILQPKSHIFTDPYLYQQECLNQFKKLANQRCFFSHKNNSQYFYPYLEYFCPEDSKEPICNRYVCLFCHESLKDNSQGCREGQTTGVCEFCLGSCQCLRCKSVDLMVKTMGMFLHHGGDLQSLTNKFLFKIVTHYQRLPSIKKDQNNTKNLNRDTIIEMIQGLKSLGIFKQSAIDKQMSKMIVKEGHEKVIVGRLKKVSFFHESFDPYSVKAQKQIWYQNNKERLEQEKNMRRSERLKKRALRKVMHAKSESCLENQEESEYSSSESSLLRICYDPDAM